MEACHAHRIFVTTQRREMNPIMHIPLPNELLPYKDQIESTIKPYIEIKAERASELAPWQSKFGGLPYLPSGTAYPRDPAGQPLFLLAQINFAETPPLASFPTSGILEFYISGTDTVYGASFNDLTNQAGFRVLYFRDPVQDEAQLVTEFAPFPPEPILPLEGPCALTFQLRQEPISTYDYQFEAKLLGRDKPGWDETTRALSEPYERLFPSLGHKLGGYPFFVQTDPRLSKKYQDRDYVLLFQMDTDSEAGIMWGDAGVGGFFIREQDLLAKDFSRLLYSWDCG